MKLPQYRLLKISSDRKGTSIKAEWVDFVTCGECKWFNEKYGSCHAYHWDLNQGLEYAEVDADDFCSYGERSEKPNNSKERSSE